MSHGRRRPRRMRPRRRLFWKVYAFGALLLLAVALSMGLTHELLGATPPWLADGERLAQHFAHDLEPVLSEPQALVDKLERVHRHLELDVAVYQADGALLGAAGRTPEPEPAMPNEYGIERTAHALRFVMPIRNTPQGAYFVVERAPAAGFPRWAVGCWCCSRCSRSCRSPLPAPSRARWSG